MSWKVIFGGVFVDVYSFFFFQAEDGIRDDLVTGVQTCALPILEEDRQGREAHLPRERGRRRHGRAEQDREVPGGRLRRAADLHREDAVLVLDRSEAARRAERARVQRARRLSQCRSGVHGRVFGRPDGSNDQSFPSGHASAAFQAASFVQRRYDDLPAWPGYVLATYTGWTRVEAKKHYASDVLAGAALGLSNSFVFVTRRDVHVSA